MHLEFNYVLNGNNKRQPTFKLRRLHSWTDLLSYGNIKSLRKLVSVDVKQIDLFTTEVHKELIAIRTECYICRRKCPVFPPIVVLLLW